MDIPPLPPPPTTATGNVTGSEIEPPNGVQPNRTGKHPAPPLTTGVLSRHPSPPLIALAYGKCNKNYSATTGGHVLDGCGEFMPSLTPTDRTFLNCDACGCHRSFHRQTDHYYPPLHHVFQYQCPAAMPPRSSSTPNSPSPSPISSSYHPTAPAHMFIPVVQPQAANPNKKKRFRSKFSEEQKEKMQEFAERIGWKMLKKDEEMIMGFCVDIGVTKRVLKVWMHNHKNMSTVKNNHPEKGGNSSTS